MAMLNEGLEVGPSSMLKLKEPFTEACGTPAATGADYEEASWFSIYRFGW